MRRMSCSLTVDQVLARTKTVTRRRFDTWLGLKPGDHLTLIEKGMGLAKGEKQVVLDVVEIVSSFLVPLWPMTRAEVDAEGFPDLTPDEFVDFWLVSHGLDGADPQLTTVRRIEWRYLP